MKMTNLRLIFICLLFKTMSISFASSVNGNGCALIGHLENAGVMKLGRAEGDYRLDFKKIESSKNQTEIIIIKDEDKEATALSKGKYKFQSINKGSACVLVEKVD